MEGFGQKVQFKLENFLSNIKHIRSKNELIDVTLVGDDGVHIGAHMVMLAACSSFFRNVFNQMNHKHPLLYLRGMHSLNISAILDFIYHGEVQVLQEHIQNFLDMAEDLGIQGMTSFNPFELIKEKGEENIMKMESSKGSSPIHEGPAPLSSKELTGILDDWVANQITMPDPPKPRPITTLEEAMAPIFSSQEEKLSSSDLEALDKQIDEITQMVGNYWACKKCGKFMKKKQHIKNHAESHLNGYSHACPHCGKHSKTRNALTNHISYAHKKPFPPINPLFLTQ